MLLGMTLLTAESLRFHHGDALQTNFLQSFLHFVQLERLDNGFDFFHVTDAP